MSTHPHCTSYTLSGQWRLATDPDNVGRQQQWCAAVPAGAKAAPVPGIIQQVYPDYHGVAWYWRTFGPAGAVAPGQRALLRFGAVDYLAEVWVNGQPVGGHEGGETPFVLDVTKALQPGREHLLAVRVLNPTEQPIDGITLSVTPHRNKVPKANYAPGSGYNYGGILLDVELLILPAVRVTDVYASPSVADGTIRLALTVDNDTGQPAPGRVTAVVTPDAGNEPLDAAAAEAVFAPGRSTHALALQVAQARRWDLDDPYLYRVTVTLQAGGDGGQTYAPAAAVRCGLRDFRVERGFFRLNGRRVLLRSTHTGNHYPIGQVVPPTPDLLRRDLIMAKASGFNCVRFISGVAWPAQLDFCDELGLMVYEESMAGWCLGDSPHMARRFDSATREMILRDRNHPCVTIWGLLNETPDGPVFRHAVQALELVRNLDATRLVLLGSGRWDAQPTIGSVCNPGGRQWEPVWGVEGPAAPKVDPTLGWSPGGYVDRAGDAHVYTVWPQEHKWFQFIRTLGRGTQPVFLSEGGIGSLFNVVDELRKYDELGAAATDAPDRAFIAAEAERLRTDWRRWGMDAVYPFPEDMLRASYRLHTRQRRLFFDLVRSNPQICGYNVTGMLDHALTGEGLWTFWREWKPGIAECLRDGFAPLRWCLFVDPLHGYTGRAVRIEATLATEDILPPGRYPVHFRIFGPHGLAWEQRTEVVLPAAAEGQDGPLAVAVLKAEATLQDEGLYTLAASLERGGCPQGDRMQFRISRPPAHLAAQGDVTLWGVNTTVQVWLAAQGFQSRAFDEPAAPRREVILVGTPVDPSLAQWQEMARRMARGATAVFLAPQAFQSGEDAVRWLPLKNKGRCYAFHDWLYHKECVAKAHPIFEGLQTRGLLDWDDYDQVIPHTLFDGQDTPDEVVAAAFATGYCCPGGYAAGVLIGVYPFGAGRLILNTMRIIENLGTHPAAERLLLNFIRYAAGFTQAPLAELPARLDTHLREIGYLE